MRKLSSIVAVLVVMALVVAACGGGSGSDGASGPSGEAGPAFEDSGVASAPTPAPAATRAPRAAQAIASFATSADTGAFQLAQVERRVVSTSNLSLEVTDVESAIVQVRGIAEGLGGFVQQLSSSGGPENQRASVTIRVPQPDFFTALELIEALGEVQSRNVGSEDVSEQFIDLEARLKSVQREEESLLSLLQRAVSVSEVLTIERELTRVRSDIERFQGQLNFLERRVAMATITVTLAPPEDFAGRPPSATLALQVDDVGDAVAAIKSLAAALAGEIDSVILSVRGERSTAELRIQVFRPDFDQAVATIEGLGELQRKEINEGQSASGGVERGRKPDAPIHVSLAGVEDSGSDNTLAIVLASVLSPLFVVAIGFAGWLIWWRRRRRA